MPDPAPSSPIPPRPPTGSHALQAPTGTRDFYPADLNRLRYIQDAWRRTSINHGFEEIDGPTFEHLDLYTIKSGEGIVSELFSFERFGGEKKFALRPEFTPTLARMYASKANALPKPTKWFWMQNCFRAERPQRGRLREFSQWNCDIIGANNETGSSIETRLSRAQDDAEVIACCIDSLQRLGFTSKDVRVHINDRRVITRILLKLGFPAERHGVILDLLDRRTKLSREEFAWDAGKIGVTKIQVDTINDLIDSAAAEGWPHIIRWLTSDNAQDQEAADTVLFVASQLRKSGLYDWCVVDPSIVRGLAYYTGMVFEVHEASGAERAIAGGGRYDGLIELFGGPPTPAVGFGMGDVVLSLVLQDRGKFPADDKVAEKLGLRPDAFIISNGTPEADAALTPTLAALRRSTEGTPGLHARRSYKATRNVGKLVQDAVKARARFAVIIESGTHATVKNLDIQQQDAEPTPLDRLAERLRRPRINEPRP